MTIYTQIGSNKRKTWLLMSLFVGLIVGLGWVFGQLYDPSLLYVAVIFSVLMSFGSYWWSDKVALAVSGAREVEKADAPELYRLVENLAITAGIPTPRVYMIDDSAPNAFATGRDPDHAVVAVTTGLVDKLEKNELEGVLAHEFAHIGNYDIRLMTIVSVMVGLIALLADFFFRLALFGGRDRGNTHPLVYVIGFALALLSPLIAMFIQLAVSRRREYLADATGALLTRYPEGLASALEKISKDREPLEVANKATAHLYFANPLKNHHDAIGWFAGLFNTHPPAEERIKRLREMGGIDG
jgi:heat shock protein HtpX